MAEEASLRSKPLDSLHRLLSSWVPVLLLELAVFYFSSRPNLQLPQSIPHLDKAAHAVEYLLVGGLLFRALRLSGMGRRCALLVALFTAAALGATDENFQRLIPGRVCSVWDWTADVCGASAGSFLASGLERRVPAWLWTLSPARMAEKWGR